MTYSVVIMVWRQYGTMVFWNFCSCTAKHTLRDANNDILASSYFYTILDIYLVEIVVRLFALKQI